MGEWSRDFSKWFECRPLLKQHSCLKTLHWQHFNSYKTGSGIPRCEPDAAGREAQSLFYAASPVKWLKANFLQSKFTRLFIIQPGPGARLKPQAVRMGQSNKFCKGQNVPKNLQVFGSCGRWPMRSILPRRLLTGVPAFCRED